MATFHSFLRQRFLAFLPPRVFSLKPNTVSLQTVSHAEVALSRRCTPVCWFSTEILVRAALRAERDMLEVVLTAQNTTALALAALFLFFQLRIVLPFLADTYTY